MQNPVFNFKAKLPLIVVISALMVLLVTLSFSTMKHTFADEPVQEVLCEGVQEIEKRCDDLGLFQVIYIEFAEVLSHYLPDSEMEELIELARYIVDKSHEKAINPYLVLAVIRVESTFDPCAISKAGAKGLMQVMPTRILGHEIVEKQYAFEHHKFYDPYENIGIGVDYLGYLVHRFKSVESAITAYNMGPTRLSRRLRQSKTPISSRYTRRVIHHYERYQTVKMQTYSL